MTSKILTGDNVNQNFGRIEPVSFNPLVKKAKKSSKEQCRDVINVYSEDPHRFGQLPITFFRQVLATTLYPEFFNDDVMTNFPSDVKEKAHIILSGCRNQSMGSYSDSSGIELIRKEVANYIEKRDGVPCNYHNIFISTGSTQTFRSVLNIMNCTVNGKPPGILIPFPRPLLYKNLIAESGMKEIPYFLDECNDWAVSCSHLQEVILKAKQHCNVRAILLVNPGNPTGSMLSRQNMEEIIKFAYNEDIVLLADEVCQLDVYTNKKFVSFKKVLSELPAPYNQIELASFMSVSKGFLSESGLRGGYCEIINLDPDVRKMLLKSITALVCSNTFGQAAVYCMANPPKPGEPSYDLYSKEISHIQEQYRKKSTLVVQELNKMEGVKCTVITGTCYAFPSISFPQKAKSDAKIQSQQVDMFYCDQLFQKTGICCLPGSEFGQEENTYHIRIVFLQPLEELQALLEKLKAFHQSFMNQYS